MVMIHILDENEKIVDFLENTSDDKLYWEDLHTEKVEDSYNTFEFKTIDGTKTSEFLTNKRKFVVRDEDGFYFAYIINHIRQEYQSGSRAKYILGQGEQIELRTAKIVDPVLLGGATPKTAGSHVLAGTRWELGIVEYSGSRTIEIKEYISSLQALHLIASTFGLELRFRVEVKGGKIVKRYVDLLMRIGHYNGKEIELGKDLIGINRISDTDELYTALYGIGKANVDGEYITFEDINQGKKFLVDEAAKQRWGVHYGVYLHQHDGDEPVSKSELKSKTGEALKKAIESQVKYEVSSAALEEIFGLSHEKVRKGDTLRIKDTKFSPPLYLEARVLEKQRSTTDKSKTSYVFGNYREIRITPIQSIKDLQKNLFRNEARWNSRNYVWIKYADDLNGTNMSDSPAGKKFIGIASNKLTETPSTIPEDYEWSLIQGPQGPQGVPGIPGPKGENGSSLYTWVKYATDDAGSNMSDLPEGRTYIGFAYNKLTDSETTNTADYTWSKIEGPQGVKGTDGKQYYTWLKYADSPTSGMSDLPTGKLYMGIAYNKTTAEESTVYSDYAWSLIKGEKGDTGLQGIQGPTGPNGQTLYTWIKYADDSAGTGMNDLPTGKKYIGLAYNNITATESTTATDYSWSLIQGTTGPQGSTGPQGPAGVDGQPTFTWIKYADTPTTGMSDSPTGKKYLGIAYNKTTNLESTVYTDYAWSLIEGPQGPQGIQGPQGPTGIQGLQGPTGATGIQGPTGANGVSSYTHIAYATNATGTTGFSVSDSVNKTYIGMYVDSIAADSTDPTRYAWTLIKGTDGAQGIQGPVGANGLTSYFHTAYATNSTGTAGFSTTDSVNKTYIGTYTDFISADSTNPTLYSWTLIKGDTGATGATGPKGDTGSQGIQGPVGPNGATLYTWLKYADTPTTGMSDLPTGNKYMGIAYNKPSATESNSYADYSWSLIEGPTGPQGATGGQGIQGPAGANGQPTYTWIKYATSNAGANLSDDPTGRAFIGLAYNKTTQTESTNPADYTWSLIQGPQGPQGNTGSQGPQGSTGPQGNTGATGATGPAGRDGFIDRGTLGSVDWNTVVTSGVYRVGYSGTKPTNFPGGAYGYGTLNVVASGNSVTQTYTVHQSPSFTYTRTKWNASDWGSWDSSAELVNGWKMSGKTTINGGMLETDSVKAVHIDVATLSAIATNIGEITAGTINGVDINGVNINGSKITSDGSGTDVVEITDGYVLATNGDPAPRKSYLQDGYVLSRWNSAERELNGTGETIYTEYNYDGVSHNHLGFTGVSSDFKIYSSGAIIIDSPKAISLTRPTNPLVHTSLSLINNWTDFGSGYVGAAYTKSVDGFVHLRGMVKGGLVGGYTMATLPAGCRPNGIETFRVPTYGGGHAEVFILSSGSIQIQTADSNVRISLCGIVFRAEN